jgi:hypothetical protein
MPLNKKDLQQIKEIVQDTVDFAISKSELKSDDRLEEIKDYIDKQTDDLAEINRELISRIDNHETRIIRLEQKPIKA